MIDAYCFTSSVKPSMASTRNSDNKATRPVITARPMRALLSLRFVPSSSVLANR